jgi:hypothetical protein
MKPKAQIFNDLQNKFGRNMYDTWVGGRKLKLLKPSAFESCFVCVVVKDFYLVAVVFFINVG